MAGSYAYVADYWDGLRVIDVSDPAHPSEVGYYDTGGRARGVFVEGSYAYVADRLDGLYILDVSYFTEIEEKPVHKPQSIYITVSPNPFNSSCAITTLTGATVEIFDLHGRLVWNKPSDSDYIGATSLIKGGKPEAVPINKGDVAKRQWINALAQGVIIWQPNETISSGVYLVRATTDDGQQITKRIVYLK